MVDSINSISFVDDKAKVQDLEPKLVDQQLFDSLKETNSPAANKRAFKAALRKAKADINNQANLNALKDANNAVKPQGYTKTQALNNQANTHEGYTITKNAAQYKGSSYSNVVHVERGISLEQAFEIADHDPEIDYFVYVKGYSMVLEIPPNVDFDPNNDPFNLVTNTPFIYDSGELGQGYCRIFHHGDVVFFKKEGMWLGSAPGLADVYTKEVN